jgi:hypothetical protein
MIRERTHPITPPTAQSIPSGTKNPGRIPAISSIIIRNIPMKKATALCIRTFLFISRISKDLPRNLFPWSISTLLYAGRVEEKDESC